MNECTSCGGTIKYIKMGLMKCEYCGRLYSESGSGLQDADLEKTYMEAKQLAQNGDIDSIFCAIEALETIGTYKDSEYLIRNYHNKIESENIRTEQERLENQRQIELKKIEQRRQEEQNKRVSKYTTYGILAVVAIIAVIIFTNATTARMNEGKYNSAVVKYNGGDYDEALSMFENLGDYSDSQGYVADIQNKLRLYSNAINYYEAGSYIEAIEAFNRVGNYAETNTYVNKIGASLYEQAQNNYNAQDYVSAKAKLQLIPNTCNIYADSNKLLQDCNYQYAVLAYNNGEYEKAQAAFIEIGIYSDAQTYLSKIGEKYYAQATQLFGQGKYVESANIIAYIDESCEWNECQKAIDFKQKITTTYINLVAEKAKDICRNEGYDAMVSYIDSTVCSILTTEVATDLKSKCEIKIVDIADMTPLIGKSDKFWYSSTSKDNVGNTYKYQLYCGGEGYTQEITYALDSNYITLKGELGLREQNNNLNDGIWIEFYGDGKKLGETIHFYKGVRPYSFEINVSGVNDLKIVCTSNSMHRDGYLLTNGFFVSE